MESQNFYIEFEISNKERYDHLLRLFNKLREEKETYYKTGIEPDLETTKWQSYLDPGAVKWFNTIILKKGSPEKEVYDKLWNLTDPEVRINHPMFNTGVNWDFESVLHVITEGDYELIKIDLTDQKGTLYYDPGGCPFGGTESLVQLIECFGHKVIYDYWHEGPHRRVEVGWDYEVAKKLVDEGKGIQPFKRNFTTTKIKKKNSTHKWWEFWK